MKSYFYAARRFAAATVPESEPATITTLYDLTLEQLHNLTLQEWNVMEMGEPPISLPYLAWVYASGICNHEIQVFSN